MVDYTNYTNNELVKEYSEVIGALFQEGDIRVDVDELHSIFKEKKKIANHPKTGGIEPAQIANFSELFSISEIEEIAEKSESVEQFFVSLKEGVDEKKRISNEVDFLGLLEEIVERKEKGVMTHEDINHILNC